MLEFKAWADREGYYCERIEVDSHFGMADLEFSDFVLMAAEAAERVCKQIESPLPSDCLKPVLDWFSDITIDKEEFRNSELATELGANSSAGVWSFINFFAKFTAGMRAGSKQALIVREKIRAYPDQLLRTVNDVLSQARKNLADQNRSYGLLLIFDNLDRYDPESISRVLVQNDSLLKKLQCHAIFTIPINLEYRPNDGPVRDAIGHPVTVPMIALRDQNTPWKNSVEESEFISSKVDELGKVLKARLAPTLFETEQDLPTIVKFSGGCIRDLLHLATLAYQFTDEGDQVLTSQSIRRGIKELQISYERELEPGEYKRLAEIAVRKTADRDELTRRLLFHRHALEYYDQEIWLDVHPLIVNLPAFQEAYRECTRS